MYVDINSHLEIFRLINELSESLHLTEYLSFVPIQEESSDPEVIGNSSLLRGDNFYHLLNLFSKSCRFNLCIIDPPYNTHNKFLYSDSIKGETSPIWGSHAPWMAYMLPRLVAAWYVLEDTGVIAISIDEKECHYLKVLMDRIFSEDCHIGNIIVCKSKNGTGSSKNIATNHEHLLVYGKSPRSKSQGMPPNISKFDKEDEYGKFAIHGMLRKKGDNSKREDRPNLFYPLYYNEHGQVFITNETGELKEALPVDSNGIHRRWIWGKEKVIKDGWKLYASAKGVIYIKSYFSSDSNVKIRSMWNSNDYLTSAASSEIKRLFGEKIFDTPKPIKLIEDIILCFTDKKSRIIDFFAGSGTTAHAAENINILDGGSRSTLLIESNSEIPKNHPAYSMGFRVISDITSRRLQLI
jgi:adenine-specific DNA-methyltransferase